MCVVSSVGVWFLVWLLEVVEWLGIGSRGDEGGWGDEGGISEDCMKWGLVGY